VVNIVPWTINSTSIFAASPSIGTAREKTLDDIGGAALLLIAASKGDVNVRVRRK